MAIAIALLPVTVFLLILVLNDSFKLVPVSMLVRALLAGALAAGLAALLHAWLFDVTGLDVESFSRYVAPLTEECLKATFLLYPLRRRKVGFLVDAAIVGFAVGTGFAVVENATYLGSLGDRTIWLWIARGFGTAFLHAMTAAIVAISAKALMDRWPRAGLVTMLPGLAGAIVLHSIYNHAAVSPVLAAALLMLVLPLIVLTIFSRSEEATREWVGDGMDLDVELLALITSPHFGTTRLGRYLTELKERFEGPVLADMFCLLQVELELSIRAKGMLMAREEGLDVPVDDSLRAQLAEREYLMRSIGHTGLVALRPVQPSNDRDEWLQYVLREAGRGGHWWRRWSRRLRSS